MRKPKKLIVGNWKMNPQTLDEAREIAKKVKAGIRNVSKTDVVLCSPFVYIPALAGGKNKSLSLGAQNVFYGSVGSYTGEVSSSQLQDFKVSFVILGHSERRKMGETDEMVNKKVKSVIGNGMTAIICIGEGVRDRDGEYFNFIKSQIHFALKEISKKSLDQVVIAYEPIWAVGAKEAITPRDLHEMSIFIKKVLKDLYGSLADSIKIIYGGDVDRVNCDELVRDGNVSGLLVGRQSLRPKDFIEIIKLVDAL